MQLLFFDDGGDDDDVVDVDVDVHDDDEKADVECLSKSKCLCWDVGTSPRWGVENIPMLDDWCKYKGHTRLAH